MTIENGRIICPRCNGEGIVGGDGEDVDYAGISPCPICNGTGEIEYYTEGEKEKL